MVTGKSAGWGCCQRTPPRKGRESTRRGAPPGPRRAQGRLAWPGQGRGHRGADAPTRLMLHGMYVH